MLIGNREIPEEIGYQHFYGITGVQFKLKSYEKYSIVYQIYIEEIGWIAPCKNEEIACYQKEMPMSAIRMALIPNSELPYLLEQWEKDTGNKLK